MTEYVKAAARSSEQLEEMKRLEAEGICVFCPEGLSKRANPIESETKHWVVTKNDFPYKHTRLHLMLIPKAHVKSVADLDHQAKVELTQLIASLETGYELDSYAVVIRAGDPRYNGGSIAHLHVHLVQGDRDDPEFEPVRFKVASMPRD